MIKKFKIESDVGGVLIGNSDWAIVIPNGHGDGDTYVEIVDRKEDLVKDLKFFTSVRGIFGVFKYDCIDFTKEEPVVILNGRYGIYYGNGKVVFELWGWNEKI